MKKVLIITYYWPPSGGPGVQRSLKFVKYLAEFGIEPIVLTVDPGSASYPLHDESLLNEVPPGTRVIRTHSFEPLRILSAFSSGKGIPHGGFANRGKENVFQKALRFIRGNFFIPDARKGWVSYAVRAATELLRKEQISTVFISSPPHSSQLIGLNLKKSFPHLNWVADLRDPWTDIYYYKDLLHTKAAAAKDAEAELQVLKSADHVIAVSEPIRQLFLMKSVDLDPQKFHVLPNGFDENDFIQKENPREDGFVITYVGTMAETYKPEVFFKVMKELSEADRSRVFLLRMVGTHAGPVKEMIDSNGLGAITEFVPQVDHDKAISYMLQSDALLLVIPDVKENEGILTGKLFEYLGSRRPVIGIGPVHGEASKILIECNAGKMFERNQESQIREYLASLLEKKKMGAELANSSSHHEKYSRKELTRQLASYL